MLFAYSGQLDPWGETSLASRLDLKDAAHSGRVGAIYAVDLFGSGLGALLIGLWALPVLGAGTTLAILAALNGIVAMGMEKARRAD